MMCQRVRAIAWKRLEVDNQAFVAHPTSVRGPQWSAIPHRNQGSGIYCYCDFDGGDEPSDEPARRVAQNWVPPRNRVR